MIRASYPDRDTAVSATLVFASGQMKDSTAVPWLDTLLKHPKTPVTVAFEAARSLGKIRTAEARSMLANYLTGVKENPHTRTVIGEALLSISRFQTRGELAPMMRHTRSADAEIRWRAAWALRRSGDPAAVPYLLQLSMDRSATVRYWAVSSLRAPRVDTAGIPRSTAVKVLINAINDRDRQVSTEAIRTMTGYDDSASFDVLRHALGSRDIWLSVSAAEALAGRNTRADDAITALLLAAQPGQPSALRIAAVFSLYRLRPESARAAGELLAGDTLPLSRYAAAVLDSMLTKKSRPTPPAPGGSTVRPPSRPVQTGKTPSDYRRLAELWVVPAYRGVPSPRVEWKTPRGVIEIELHSSDAPLATDVFMQIIADSAFARVEFYKAIPNFVIQQKDFARPLLRDEVNRLGLKRGTLSWGSFMLDTAPPNYTIGITPQPHNEGDYTALGHVVRGMQVVDRIEAGDLMVSARRIR
jgi:cyclophilin family peptidyl-prolyl cis-trans isomerase/HEAT repeat protein